MKYKLQLLQGDITQLRVDAIVNPADPTLSCGGGINGAIHKAAGPELLEECKQLNGCLIGHSKATYGYNLPAKYVIHTVGPIWRGGIKGEPQLLAACYSSILKITLEKNIKSIALPAISCGVYGYPVTQAATIAVKETANFLELHNNIDTVYFVCFDQPCFEAYQRALSTLTYDE